MLLTVWWMLCCRDTIFPSITRLGSSVRICRGLLTKAAPLLHVEFQALLHPTVSPLCSWPENRLPLTSHCSKTPARRQQQSPPPPPDLGCFLLLRGFGWTSVIQGFSRGGKKKKKKDKKYEVWQIIFPSSSGSGMLAGLAVRWVSVMHQSVDTGLIITSFRWLPSELLH